MATTHIEVSGLSRSEYLTLHAETHAAIYRYVSRRLGRNHAEDLTAATFSDAWASRGRYDPAQSSPKTWVWSIVHKLMAKHVRTEIRRLRAIARLARESFMFDSTGDIDRRLDAADEWPEVAERIAALEQADRDLLLLFAWSELSYQEIADVVEVPIGTVKSRLSRIRTRIGGEVRKVVA